MPGALNGLRIIELASIGPGPFCGMMLADHGAEVIRIDRPGATLLATDALTRSRRSICVDLKAPAGVALVRDLARSAHGLIEGFRPGVIERLGLGPEMLLADNPGLVIGRMTGWGQDGPLAHAAGHDINYISLAGALHTIGRPGAPPTVPANYLGDFGGGGMMLAFGMVAALLAVRNGAPGQVIDCAIVDGTALLMGMSWALHAEAQWQDRAGTNMLDGGAHFYDAYETADGRFISIGAIEPQFYALLRARAGLTEDADFDAQHDRAAWPALKQKLADLFRTKTREQWCALLEATDACFAPVLSLAEAPAHPHNAARGTYVKVAGAVQPAPAPRLAGTPSPPPAPSPKIGADTDSVLASIGYDAARIAALRASRAVA